MADLGNISKITLPSGDIVHLKDDDGPYVPIANSATNGQVWTADGNGSASWENPQGSGGTVTSIATSGAITTSSGSTITTSGTITHRTGNGYNHIPADGASGEILRYNSAGTAEWGSEAITDITAGGTTIVNSDGIGILPDITAVSGGTAITCISTDERYQIAHPSFTEIGVKMISWNSERAVNGLSAQKLWIGTTDPTTFSAAQLATLGANNLYLYVPATT